MNKQQSSHGFTLVEIAVVLVIIGLLIGGVLRAQELLNSTRASTVVTQQSSMQTAFYGFVDRYKMLPGDLDSTQALLINNSTAPASASGDGNVLLVDSPAFFNNLAQAGFITCEACSGPSVITVGATATTAATYVTATAALSALNSPVNAYGQPLAFYFNTGATAGSTPIAGGSTAGSINFLGSSAEGGKPLMLTGGVIPSPILSEIDRKKDDGAPGSGGFRYTDIVGTSGTTGTSIFVSVPASNACFSGTAPFIWVVNSAGNCQAASIL